MSNYIPIIWTTWKKIGKFLEKYSLPKLNQDKIENTNRPITDTEIKAIIKKKILPVNKNPETDAFKGEFQQKFKELTLILLKLFQKTAEGGKLPNSLYETKSTLMPKPDKYATRKENYRPISLMNIDAKIFN